jgi:hypothetical protein
LLELFLFLPFLLITALALWRSSVRERRVIKEELAGEATNIVSPKEYQEVLGDRILQTRRIDPMRRRVSSALVNAQHELGFRNRRVRERGNDPRSDDLAAGWREDIRRLRAFIPG